MADDLESLLRAAAIPDPDRADAHWAEYRSAGPGAEAAFRTLLAWYGLALYRRVWGFVRSDAADDVFQDVLAKLHRDRGKLATWADAHTWLRTVAVRETVTLYRRDRRRQAREARHAFRPDDADPGDGPATAVACAELRAALVRLPESHQQVVALLFFEGLSVVEAAKVLGKDRDTVAAWRDAALGRLRRMLPAAGLAAGGSAGVEGALAAGRPVVSSLRLGELARSAWTRAVPGPALGKAAAVLLAGLTLGGVGLAGWVAWPAPKPEVVQVPPKVEPAPAAEPETLQAKNLRILHTRVLPELAAILAEMTEGGQARVTRAVAEGSHVEVEMESSQPLPGRKDGCRVRLRFCVLDRRLVTMFARDGAMGTTGWYKAGLAVGPDGWTSSYGWSDAPGEPPYRGLDGPRKMLKALDALPHDDRAGPEFAKFHLGGPPYGGTELIVSGRPDAHYAGNSRYLYWADDGYLFARDSGGGFDGWRWIGTQPAESSSAAITANDEDLFVCYQGEVWTRPAEPVPHPWRPAGPLPADARGFKDCLLAATRSDLFARHNDGSVWARKVDERAGWKKAGMITGGVLHGAIDRLIVVGDGGQVFAGPPAFAGPFESLGWEVSQPYRHAVWAGRLIRWSHNSTVLARPLTPGRAVWSPIGRVDRSKLTLGWRW